MFLCCYGQGSSTLNCVFFHSETSKFVLAAGIYEHKLLISTSKTQMSRTVSTTSKFRCDCTSDSAAARCHHPQHYGIQSTHFGYIHKLWSHT